MKILLILIAILFSIQTVMAQKRYLEVNKIYPSAKIYQKGKSEILKASNLEILNDSLLKYKDIETGNNAQQLLTSDIRYISVKSGNYANNYALYGGAVGLLSSLIGVLGNDPSGNSGINWIPFIAGFTGGGAIIGGLVGVLSPRWKTLYIPKQLSSHNINFTPDINKYYCGLGLKITF